MFGRIRERFIRLLVFLATPLEDERTAIWSIPKPLVPVYFLVFIGASVWTIYELVQLRMAEYCGFVWTIAAAGENDCLATWNTLVREVAAEYAPVGVGLAIGALIAVHGAAGIMALYQFLTNALTKPAIERNIAKGREEGRVEGREEGRVEGRVEGRTEGLAEANRRWGEWLQRRNDAEAEGRPFDEPPPNES